MNTKNRFDCLWLVLFLVLLLALAEVRAGETTRISVSTSGVQGNDFSSADQGDGGLSADGRYVLFYSNASNLVPGDTNKAGDIFVHDRVTGQTTRVSVGATGAQGNGNSQNGSISADGRYAAFVSTSSNLITGDINQWPDVFVHDLRYGQTALVSISSSGAQANSWNYGKTDISADGRYVLFYSNASNLVPGDTNNAGDIFVHDRVTGQTARISVSSAGEQGNGWSFSGAISANGRYVAFVSEADNLVVGDTNGVSDVFVRDRMSNLTERVSISSTGAQGNNFAVYDPAISADGRYVSFNSYASNLVANDGDDLNDVFVRDRTLGRTMRVEGDIGQISADGRYVVFKYGSEIRVRDRLNGSTEIVSVDSAGRQGNNTNYYGGAISADGRYVAFGSYSDNLVAGDTNGDYDAFVRDRFLDAERFADLKVTAIVNSTGSSAAASIGQAASIGPIISVSPSSRYTFTILNNGPDSASNLALTHVVFNGMVTAITPSQGSCSRAAISICRLNSLAAGANATVTVTINASYFSPLSQQVSVSASPRDEVPLNNSIRLGLFARQ